MTPPRSNIAGLMLLTILVAVAVAALREPSRLWAGSITTLAFVLNLLAVTTIFLGEGRLRVLAQGFAICGGGYFWFSFVGPGLNNTFLISSKLTEIVLGGSQLADEDAALIYQVADSLASILVGAVGGAYASYLRRPGTANGRPIITPLDQP